MYFAFGWLATSERSESGGLPRASEASRVEMPEIESGSNECRIGLLRCVVCFEFSQCRIKNRQKRGNAKFIS